MGQLVIRIHQSSSSGTLIRLSDFFVSALVMETAITKQTVNAHPVSEICFTTWVLPFVKDAIHWCYNKRSIHVFLCNTTSSCVTTNTSLKALAPPCSEWAAGIASQTANYSRMVMAVSASQTCSFPAVQLPPRTLLTALHPLLMSTTSFEPLSPSY